ncbi:small fragment nuclease isoform X2 [Betta splendens]|nr:small fragment nuclease isoform X2 [Betta splendens]XP_055370682.1 small fragment nuclease isoform X2 [Betta splendens]
MTGLDIERDQIIEMACIITDSDLNILAEGPNLIINQPDELLDGMSEWCKEHHGKSGLTQAVKDSQITLEHAQYEFLSFVRQHTPPGQCHLAGNSVHADKRFLEKYMPQLMHHFHYRIIDVSTIKELCRWTSTLSSHGLSWSTGQAASYCSRRPGRLYSSRTRLCYWTIFICCERIGRRTAAVVSRRIQNGASEKSCPQVYHKKALDDILESIKELQYYRVTIFKPTTDEKKGNIAEKCGSNRS